MKKSILFWIGVLVVTLSTGLSSYIKLLSFIILLRHLEIGM